jgi:hypothetical protein
VEAYIRELVDANPVLQKIRAGEPVTEALETVGGAAMHRGPTLTGGESAKRREMNGRA